LKEGLLANPKVDENLFKCMIQGVRDYAIFALNPQGIITTWNMGAERIKGYKADEIIGQHFSIFYTKEAIDTDHPATELKLAISNGSYEEEGWRLRKDGSQFWANVVITPLFNEQGIHIGFAKVTRDLSERKHALETNVKSAENLKTTEKTFELMVSAVKDYAIFVLSPEGTIKTWNQGAQRIKGYTANEAIGQNFSMFYTEEAKRVNHPAYELEQATKYGSYEEEGWRVRKDGSQLWASVTITAIKNRDADDADGIAGFVKVTRDLTERKQNQVELEKARDEAILANQLKTQFVANVTHEIRTPLTGIVGLSELISEGKEPSAELHDMGRRIFDASKQLLVILNDLLDFAKLEAGKVAIETVPFEIGQLVDQVRGLTETKAQDKALSFMIKVDNGLPKRVTGDPTKIRQVLLNLVSNAIKFTESGGIEISVEQQEDSILYSVTDTGIGIAEEIHTKLFQPFAQAHESTTRLFGGTGLGLSIAHQFIELMHGQIGIASEPGQGTTVWFSLPLHSAKQGQDAKV
jgi:PAS domain S-box-containing protein